MQKHEAARHSNRLAAETSLYLRQHAANPVDWYPWGPEALERARAEDRPILLSIGYSACHWCHVMAHESFEDPVVAELMNRLFVCVKVDREERPDLDRIYQTAHQLLTQRGGGWPLTMFLSPRDQRPFFGGTYFPPEPRHGLPAFREVLERVATWYAAHRDEAAKLGADLVAAFAHLQPPAGAAADLTREPLAKARAALTRDFDGTFGGFGGAPKFPHPANLEFLLGAWRATADDAKPDLQALFMATLTLTRMSEGGLYDQLGGGWCRYSVDPYWMIPHFEKMLYDNGQLLAVASQAAVATGEPLFRRVAGETADWLRREMEHPDGGYYATLDADSEGHEGRYYVWTPGEARAALEPGEYAVLSRRYGLDRGANFEGAWHLHAYVSMAEIAGAEGLDEHAASALLDSARTKLLAVRERRVRPGRDEKILVSWNGLAISGLAAAARALDRPDLAEAADRAASFLHAHCRRDGRLLAVHAGGHARQPAYLDDYAMLAWGLTDLLQARWDSRWLAWAVELAEVLLAHFEDREAGGFWFTADDAETLILRPKTWADDATPSGNGVAARLLVRLGYLLAEPRYLAAAERTLRAAWPMLDRYPQAHTTLLEALDGHTAPPVVVVLRGAGCDLRDWRGELDKYYDPKRYVIAVPADATGLPAALADKAPQATTVAYVCRGTTCSAPLTTLGDLLRELRG
ncbi:MAG: thioredoxin domain-containing protein [Steroidobacteraceae bacterium]